jgi:hypothetical protein
MLGFLGSARIQIRKIIYGEHCYVSGSNYWYRIPETDEQAIDSFSVYRIREEALDESSST